MGKEVIENNSLALLVYLLMEGKHDSSSSELDLLSFAKYT